MCTISTISFWWAPILIVLDDCISRVFSHWAWELIKKPVTAGTALLVRVWQWAIVYHDTVLTVYLNFVYYLFSGHRGVCVKAEAFDGVSGSLVLFSCGEVEGRLGKIYLAAVVCSKGFKFPKKKIFGFLYLVSGNIFGPLLNSWG